LHIGVNGEDLPFLPREDWSSSSYRNSNY
jgi:hypothetical protein